MKFAIKAATAVALVLALLQSTATAAEPVVKFGASDADSIEVISGNKYSKNAYWWDHTNLTILVSTEPSQPHTNADSIQALRDAIALWSRTLARQIPQISLTDVTGKSSKADITLRYDPTFGGVNFGGLARCGGSQKCQISVRDDLPRPLNEKEGIPDYLPIEEQRTALHEIGHAVGLGHATPLETSLDLMAYGWLAGSPEPTPILSDCDLNGIRAAFSWVFANEPPHPARVASVQC